MIELTGNGETVQVSAIEYRPGDGLVIRVADDVRDGLGGLGEALSAVLHASAYRIYRECCDSAPVGDEAHAGDCKNAKKGKAK